MKRWSAYNKLLSLKFGYFLYNALSGKLLQLDEKHYLIAKCIRRDGLLLLDESPKFFEALISSGFLSDAKEERYYLSKKSKEREYFCAYQSRLMLSICPTLECNFQCLYCFEPEDRDQTVMNLTTMNKLIDFIRYHKNAQELSVTWYGGEPTMAFDVVEAITERILNIFPDYDNATLITNAFLLDCRKIEKLNSLRIRSVQITLDGPEAIHDKRRPLKGGYPTYQTILDNMDILMNSSYTGSCVVRINVDDSNNEIFTSFCSDMLGRYINKAFSVYAVPLQVSSSKETVPFLSLDVHESDILLDNVGCNSNFYFKTFRYPDGNNMKTCTALIDNAYVVAPDGLLYKCWKDIGQPERAAGSLYNGFIDNPNSVTYQYKTEGDPYFDSNCLVCNLFPVCDGGCANYRIYRKNNDDVSRLECHLSHEKELERCLEKYVNAYLRKEACELILSGKIAEKMKDGFRFIDPYERYGYGD
jgi:uncharacterized protein